MSPEKKELLELEATGEYVFHGTGEDVAQLEPRQAIDTKSGPDGPPAVFASDRAEYAIFMAIVNGQNCGGSSQSSVGGTATALRYSMTQETHDRLRESAEGWVYVFPKAGFERRDTS